MKTIGIILIIVIGLIFVYCVFKIGSDDDAGDIE